MAFVPHHDEFAGGYQELVNGLISEMAALKRQLAEERALNGDYSESFAARKIASDEALKKSIDDEWSKSPKMNALWLWGLIILPGCGFGAAVLYHYVSLLW